MAQVTVFVDDAVRGTLPQVCVKDGVRTADQLIVREELGDRAGLGMAWVLVLLGPLGWLGLLLISSSRGARGEVLTVQLPMSEAAYQRLRAARRLGRNALIAGALSTIVALMTLPTAVGGTQGGVGNPDALTSRAIALVACMTLLGAVITRFIADRRVRDGSVQVDLDASRRWVTLSRVHPAFATVSQAHQQRQDQRT